MTGRADAAPTAGGPVPTRPGPPHHPHPGTHEGLTKAHTRLSHVDPHRPAGLCVPRSATDHTSTLLVWNKPEHPVTTVVDHEVLMDGHPIGLVSDNAADQTPAQPYIEAFAENDDGGFHVVVLPHTYRVTGLRPRSRHTFAVRAVFEDGSCSRPSDTIAIRTAAAPHRVTITDHGAVGDGKTINTTSIQDAIDSCADHGRDADGTRGHHGGRHGHASGGTVVVPEGTFVTGALFLRSNITLELQAGARLKGSAHWQDYPIEDGYYLYAVPDPEPTEDGYTQYLRPPSLLNVVPSDNGRAQHRRRPGAAATNVRIVGPGVIDGNGWKRTKAGSTSDELGNPLPDYRASSADGVEADGILAADQTAHARAATDSLPGIVHPPEKIEDSALYGQYRSSLATFIGVDGLFISGVTIENPAMHGLMFLDSENVTVYGTTHTTFDTNNGDGLEFGGTRRALVAGNMFDTGDDVVNFAAGQGKYGAEGRSTQDIWVQGNYIRRGHGGIAMGSHTAAWIQHVLAEDNVFHMTETGALRMKSTSDMSGGTRDIIFRDSAASWLKSSAVIASLSYSLSPSGYVPADSATFEHITVSNVSIEGNGSWTGEPPTSADHPAFLVEAGPAVDADPVGPFTVEHVRFRDAVPGKVQGLTGSSFGHIRFESALDDRLPFHLDDASVEDTFHKVRYRDSDGHWKRFAG
jgi:exo-poly-alpha-galacturonosidase